MTLLDVNVLFALGWEHHTHHPMAKDWFDSRGDEAWATCLLTQSAFLRLSLNPHAMGTDVAVADALAILRGLASHPKHRYLDATPSISEEGFETIAGRLAGYRQMTDATLLHVAAHHGASLATFDQRVAPLASEGCRVELIGS